jgi:tetratricopeptide (TPR) repeat protein
LKRIWPVAAFLVLCIGVSGAMTLRRNTDYRSALALWEDAARKNRFEDIRSMVSYGIALEAAGRYDEAMNILEQALKTDFSKRRFSIENIKVLAGRLAAYYPLDVMREILEFIVWLDPSDDGPLVGLGQSYIANGDLVNARKAASLACRLFYSPSARVLMGDVYAASGALDLADREYAAAWSMEPNNPRWPSKRVENAIRSGDRTAVADLLDQVRRDLTPGDAALYQAFVDRRTTGSADEVYRLCAFYAWSGDFALCRAAADQFAATAAAASSTQLLDIARICLYIRDLDAAIAMTNTVRQAMADPAPALLLLAEIHQAAGRPSEAAACLEEVLATTTDPENAFVLRRRIAVLAGGGRS